MTAILQPLKSRGLLQNAFHKTIKNRNQNLDISPLRGPVEKVTATVWNAKILIECFALLAEVVLDVINQGCLCSGFHDNSPNRPRWTMGGAPEESGRRGNHWTVDFRHRSTLRPTEVPDVIEESLDRRCATESREARQCEVLRLGWFTFTSLELDKFAIFNNLPCALFSDLNHSVPFEAEAGLAEAGNEGKRFLLCRLIRFDVLPKHALAVRSGKSQ
jgi:hypothetical protein